MSDQTVNKIRVSMEQIYKNEAVQKAMTFLQNDQYKTIEELKELVVIEAPTFQEGKRAEAYKAKLCELGLSDVTIDCYGNVYGWRRGKGTGPVILVEGHLDTVFPAGTDLTPHEKDGRIYAPGIGDDTMALASILSILRALNAAGLETEGDLLFAGTAAEEGLGGMGGMKGLLEEHPEIAASLSIDGSSECDIIYNATGIINYAVKYEGPGGHAYGAFGTPSPLHAAARSIAKIAAIKPPVVPKTTYTVSFVKGGHAIHAIAQEASFTINMRSDSADELETLTEQVRQCIEAGADEENGAWDKPVVKVSYEKILDVPAGSQSEDAWIVQGACAAVRTLGKEPRLIAGGCTNGNRSIAASIPAVTLGRGGLSGGVHTLDEWFDPTDSYKAAQNTLLIALLLAGTAGVAPLAVKK
ncbi:MAG: M20/M25/M40 family metallo-hydrolase [Sporomusaceae bacterium]|nr:M20/M25/M40 family metallo-hydrolase [Sporomusaceae bacterium]